MRSLSLNRARTSRVVAGLAAVLVAGAACADKAFNPVQVAINPRMKLLISANAGQAAVAPSAKYLWVGVGGVVGKDTKLLAMANVPVTGATQTITLDVDLSKCIAANAEKGSGGCSILVAATLRADSISPADTTGDLLSRSFDYVILGPYDVSSGRAPTIPNIDLSVTRFSIFEWQHDGALRLGNAQNAVLGTGGAQERILAGTTSGTAAPVLYTVTQAIDFASFNPLLAVPVKAYPALAIFENGTWRQALATTAPAFDPSRGFDQQGFMDVTAPASNDVYAAGTSGLYKFDGSTFAKITNVTDSLWSVASAPVAGGGRVVIAGGSGGAVWIGYGTSWQRFSTGLAARIDGVCISATNEAFAVNINTGIIFRFNGTTWTSVPVPSPHTTLPKRDLQCGGPGQAFVNAGGFFAYKWTGSTWEPMKTNGLSLARNLRMAAVSATEIYAASDSGNTDRAFYKFDGTSWTEIARRTTTGPFRLWADPRGGAAYIHSGLGRLDRIAPSSVTTLSLMPNLRDAVMTSATSGFAVGWNLFLSRWDGSKWTNDAPPAGVQITRALQGVWSDGPSNAWAVGEANSILRYNGSAWSAVSSVNKPIANTDNYNAVWGVGSDVWVAGDNTILHCKATASCAVEASGGGILYSLWGSAANNVFAVGAGGRILRYNGTAWSQMASPTNRALARIAGSSASDIWAVGDSVLMHFDGTTWTVHPVTENRLRSKVPSQLSSGGGAVIFQIGLWVRGPKEAYIGGDGGVIFRWDGAEWRQVSSGDQGYQRRILSITGAAGCAMAVTEGVSDAGWHTLWRGVGTSGCMGAPMGAPSSWP